MAGAQPGVIKGFNVQWRVGKRRTGTRVTVVAIGENRPRQKKTQIDTAKTSSERGEKKKKKTTFVFHHGVLSI